MSKENNKNESLTFVFAKGCHPSHRVRRLFEELEVRHCYNSEISRLDTLLYNALANRLLEEDRLLPELYRTSLLYCIAAYGKSNIYPWADKPLVSLSNEETSRLIHVAWQYHSEIISKGYSDSIEHTTNVDWEILQKMNIIFPEVRSDYHIMRAEELVILDPGHFSGISQHIKKAFKGLSDVDKFLLAEEVDHSETLGRWVEHALGGSVRKLLT
jgi:hypothetical protein